MFKNLIYNGITYTQFVINECGDIKNLKTNHVYKPTISYAGYLIVTLPDGQRGKVKSIRVHKAVAETFLPNPDNLPVVHHKDNNKTNPNLDNLEWVTYQDNTLKHLDDLSQITDFYNNRKLTQEDVKTIKNLYPEYSMSKLAQMYNVSKTTILNVLHNIYYQNVG